MPAVNDFLTRDVEGYLFGDLKAMVAVSPNAGATGGGLGYPIVMSTFAGIELFGALLSAKTFNTYSGAEYFRSYWCDSLYPTRPNTAQEADTLYQLVRHGIAHAFLLKGQIGIVKDQPSVHLHRDTSGVVYVDAGQLATDLMASYDSHFKPILSRTTGLVNATSIQARLDDMEAEYKKQAAKLSTPSIFSITSVDAIAPISGTVPPAVTVTIGPTGPIAATTGLAPTPTPTVSGPTFSTT